MTGASPATPTLRTARVRIVAGAILIVIAVALAFDLARFLPLQAAWFDACERLSPRMAETTPVTIVAIDDSSLDALGRWPWPRSRLADLVTRIAAFSPGAIGLDIVMPEPDPLSPERALESIDADAALRERVAALPTNDVRLAAALHAAPTVLAMVGALGATSQPLHAAPILVGDAHAVAQLTSYPAALSSVAILGDAAHGWGLISAEDTRGIVRAIPLVANVGGTLVPGLAIEMWRVALDAPVLRLLTDAGAARGVRVGGDTFPAEADGSARPWFSTHRPDRFVSAADVLNGIVDPATLGRTFVLIGVTGLALGDYVWTPAGKMPGVEVHAQVLENMQERTFLVRPRMAPFVEAVALLVTGGLLILFLPRWTVRYATMLAAACIVTLSACGYGAFTGGRLLFDAATPAVALALLFATLIALQLADATRHRKALQRVLQREREEAARVAGELQAARRIQLDTLPRAEAFHDPRVELAASMEPAQEVGGDLYDFFRLDEHRLFFMLGDVSGKGLSASMFMAVSKALCKSTMLRNIPPRSLRSLPPGGAVSRSGRPFPTDIPPRSLRSLPPGGPVSRSGRPFPTDVPGDADLGALLSQANVEVARDNPGAFFVTVFAGVLDLCDGTLDYCNAGQENPWRRRAGDGTVTRLAEGGGPPLCVVDDFAYRSERVRLQPGDVVCVVSDGVTEANDPAGALYGAARVDGVLVPAASAAAAVEAIRSDVYRFAAGAAAADDMTVLAVRWCGSNVAPAAR